MSNLNVTAIKSTLPRIRTKSGMTFATVQDALLGVMRSHENYQKEDFWRNNPDATLAYLWDELRAIRDSIADRAPADEYADALLVDAA